MSGASTLELWCAIVSALFVAFLLGASFGYILAIRQLWGVRGAESLVGQDVSDEPTFLRGQRQHARHARVDDLPLTQRIPYESALRDVR